MNFRKSASRKKRAIGDPALMTRHNVIVSSENPVRNLDSCCSEQQGTGQSPETPPRPIGAVERLWIIAHTTDDHAVTQSQTQRGPCIRE